ncbi:NUDIX hydrolase [Corynebacterium lehmanniae]
MLGDGNGWVTTPDGTRLWGRFGAAGLFLVAGSEADAKVLLQHRAGWTAQGGTWGIPGGARDSHETPAQAAVRESVEECAIDPGRIDVVEELVTTDLPEWSYTTVIALCEAPLAVTANEESEELRWVPLAEISGFALHPGFAASLSNVLAKAMVHTEPHD